MHGHKQLIIAFFNKKKSEGFSAILYVFSARCIYARLCPLPAMTGACINTLLFMFTVELVLVHLSSACAG
jgi:hypothetical protein